MELDKQLDLKKNILSEKFCQLKEEYRRLISLNINDPNIVKISLINQIEILTELINTIKMKINLIQNTEAVV
jgi:hypothetical protein